MKIEETHWKNSVPEGKGNGAAMSENCILERDSCGRGGRGSRRPLSPDLTFLGRHPKTPA